MNTYTIHHRHGGPVKIDAVSKDVALQIVAMNIYGTPTIGDKGWSGWKFTDFRDMFLCDGVIYEITCWAYEKGPHKDQIYFKAWPWKQQKINGDTGLKLVADLLAKHGKVE